MKLNTSNTPTASQPHPHPRAPPPHAAQTAAPQSVTPGSRAVLSSPHPPREAGGASGSSGASSRRFSRP
eukprot:scaffold2686_cov167-Pinguiococcus_pyrenoidosus.AAC.1